jgi:hypothetical protein
LPSVVLVQMWVSRSKAIKRGAGFRLVIATVVGMRVGVSVGVALGRGVCVAVALGVSVGVAVAVAVGVVVAVGGTAMVGGRGVPVAAGPPPARVGKGTGGGGDGALGAVGEGPAAPVGVAAGVGADGVGVAGVWVRQPPNSRSSRPPRRISGAGRGWTAGINVVRSSGIKLGAACARNMPGSRAQKSWRSVAPDRQPRSLFG